MTNASKIRVLSCLPWRHLNVRTIFNCFNPPIVEVFKLGSHIISLEVGFDQRNRTCVSCNMNGTTVQSKIVVEPKDGKVLEVYYDEVPKKKKNLLSKIRKKAYYDEDESGGTHDIRDREIICTQLIERSIRPLFSSGLSSKTMVYARVLESNARHDADLLAIIATSAALMISNDTQVGPIGAIRIGRIDEKIIINPTTEEQRESDINLFYVCTREKTVLVDVEAPEISESDLETNLKIAHLEAVKCIESLVRLRDRYGKDHKSEVLKTISKNMHDTRSQSSNAWSRKLENKKSWILKRKAHIMEMKSEGYQFDRRCLHQIRPIECQLGYIPWGHGSSYLSCGVTKVFCSTILSKPDQALRADSLGVPPRKRFSVDYDLDSVNAQLNEPLEIEDYDSYSDREIREIMDSTPQSRKRIRREIGQGMFVTKALRAVIPSIKDFPYYIYLQLTNVASSPAASVCGGSIALMDAGIPVRCHVAGVSISLVTISETSNGQLENYRTITDILSLEDDLVEMDCKVAGTRNGITAIQLDVKSAAISLDIICEALSYGRQARLQILDQMEQILDSPKITSSILVNPGRRMPLDNYTAEVGEVYKCIVTSIIEKYGQEYAKVEYNGDTPGLLYPWELSNEKVSKVSDVLSIGKHITLKCIRKRHGDIFEFSLKAVE